MDRVCNNPLCKQPQPLPASAFTRGRGTCKICRSAKLADNRQKRIEDRVGPQFCSNAACEQVNPQPLTAFSPDRKNCRSCVARTKRRSHERDPSRSKANRQRWKANNKSRHIHLVRSSKLRRKYGITIEQYDQMLIDQGGACKICRSPASAEKFRLAIDHCHRTGLVRGLLCHRCNKALGLLRDDPKLFDEAAAYLRQGQLRSVA